MIPHEIPTRPWKKIGIDYFTLLNQDYLLIIDYFSKYPEIIPVASKTAGTTSGVAKVGHTGAHARPTLSCAPPSSQHD